MSSSDSSRYVKLTQIEHVKSRPDTYIGSVEISSSAKWIMDENNKFEKKIVDVSEGALKCIDEILSNARDRLVETNMQYKCNEIRVSVDIASGFISVMNNGDGIPIVNHDEYGVYIPELIFGNLLTSTNYDDSETRIAGGRNGLGAKLTNIFSLEMSIETVDVVRKLKYEQTFEKNLGVINLPKISKYSKKPYTCVKFRLDLERFGLTHLTDTMISLIKKRTMDIAATIPSCCGNTKIYFQDEIVSTNSFEKYMDCFYSCFSDKVKMYEVVNDRWKVGVLFIPQIGFSQISYVNSIATYSGGTHVNYVFDQIYTPISKHFAGKKKIKQADIKDHIILFVDCLIDNPSFNSQTKEELVTDKKKFGSTCILSDKFLTKVMKSGIISIITESYKIRDNLKINKSDGKKVNRIKGLPKLEDAENAGTMRSKDCMLILTEGDSAKASAMAGLSVIGRKNFGIFPLKGKLLNVRDSSTNQILKNEEIQNIKRILGLKNGTIYNNTSELRYGKGIVIFTDQDVDGSHIKGLLMNFFHHFWPNLLVETKNYITCLTTPIVKASKGNLQQIFYNLSSYDKWSETVNKKEWKVKYYKGLGTSTSLEAKEYFRDFDNKLITYQFDEDSNESFELAFSKKMADKRKCWLMNYDSSDILNNDVKKVSYTDFINRELIHFSNDDNKRSLPSVIDGLKPSQRKILYGCYLRKLDSTEIKVSQLSGFVSDKACYHHGENSLNNAIIGMASNFVGSNNIEWLVPNGQFGCVDPETPVLMWDSSIKKANDIVVGDVLVGDDGSPRTVSKTTRGIDKMYKIRNGDMDEYSVNSNHILTLLYSPHKKIFISPLKKSWVMKYFNRETRSFCSKAIKIDKIDKNKAYEKMVEFSHTVQDSGVIDINLQDYMNLPRGVRQELKGIVNSSLIQWKQTKVDVHPYTFGINLGSWNHTIPQIYICNSKENRLDLLTGAIITNGSKSTDDDNNTYYILSYDAEKTQIIEGLRIIAGSLGYKVKVKTSNKKIELVISDKNRNLSAFMNEIDVTCMGEGSFCGWNIDGNERFLMGDFTITHNTRLQGSKDAASPRYIWTSINSIVNKIIRKEDADILEYNDDDGISVEPSIYLPILPMILVNGSEGIGTGFSTFIPPFNPKEIIRLLKRVVSGNEELTEEDYDLVPYYRGFKGDIIKKEPQLYHATGLYEVIKKSIRITELPVGTWTSSYKEFLCDLVEKKVIDDFVENNTDVSVDFTIYMKEIPTDVIATFKLSKTIRTSNMHMYSSEFPDRKKAQIKKYSGIREILDDYIETRLRGYELRKEFILDKLKKEISVLDNKIRFINLIISGDIVINNCKHETIISKLVDLEFMKMDDKFDYLIHMKLYSLTKEKIDELLSQQEKKKYEYTCLHSKTCNDIWLQELTELEVYL